MRSQRIAHIRIVTWLASNHLSLAAIILPATALTLAKVPEYAVASHHLYMAAAETPNRVARTRRDT